MSSVGPYVGCVSWRQRDYVAYLLIRLWVELSELRVGVTPSLLVTSGLSKHRLEHSTPLPRKTLYWLSFSAASSAFQFSSNALLTLHLARPTGLAGLS